jgi:hypothetical protein
LEKVQLEKLGTFQTLEGKWLLPDGRETLSKPLMREVMTKLHWGESLGNPSHVWCYSQSLCTSRNLTLAKQVTQSCLTCRKVNKQVLREQLPWGRNPGLRLFPSIQVDYTVTSGRSLKIFARYNRPSNQLGQDCSCIKCHYK